RRQVLGPGIADRRGPGKGGPPAVASARRGRRRRAGAPARRRRLVRRARRQMDRQLIAGWRGLGGPAGDLGSRRPAAAHPFRRARILRRRHDRSPDHLARQSRPRAGDLTAVGHALQELREASAVDRRRARGGRRADRHGDALGRAVADHHAARARRARAAALDRDLQPRYPGRPRPPGRRGARSGPSGAARADRPGEGAAHRCPAGRSRRLRPLPPGAVPLEQAHPEGLRQAVEYFQQTIAADPTYAPAYAGLADSYSLLGFLGHEPREQAFRQAKAAAARAVALDGSLADAHASLGLVMLNNDWDGAGAERAYREALELNPSYAAAHHWLAAYLISAGRLDEAARHLRLALQLNPFSPTIVTATAEHALIVRDYDRAVEQARKAIELEPRYATAHEQLWYALHAKGKPAEAFAELAQTLSLSGYPETARRATRAYARAGYRAALLAACDHLADSRPGDTGGWLIAEAAALAGDRDRAIAWLETAFKRHDPSVLWLGQMWQWDGVRG